MDYRCQNHKTASYKQRETENKAKDHGEDEQEQVLNVGYMTDTRERTTKDTQVGQKAGQTAWKRGLAQRKECDKR